MGRVSGTCQPFPNKLNGGDARLDGLKPTWAAASVSEAPTSTGNRDTIGGSGRPTGRQRQERRESGASKAATERGTYARGSDRTGVSERPEATDARQMKTDSLRSQNRAKTHVTRGGNCARRARDPLPTNKRWKSVTALPKRGRQGATRSNVTQV